MHEDFFDDSVAESGNSKVRMSEIQENSCSHGLHIWEQASDQYLPKKRALLTDDQAAEIFNLRVTVGQDTSIAQHRFFTSRSIAVSQMYGVSPKAVRDIWNKRTWRHATRSLWTEDDAAQRTNNAKVNEIFARAIDTSGSHPSRVGRPRGSKDTKPRLPRRLCARGRPAAEPAEGPPQPSLQSCSDAIVASPQDPTTQDFSLALAAACGGSADDDEDCDGACDDENGCGCGGGGGGDDDVDGYNHATACGEEAGAEGGGAGEEGDGIGRHFPFFLQSSPPG